MKKSFKMARLKYVLEHKKCFAKLAREKAPLICGVKGLDKMIFLHDLDKIFFILVGFDLVDTKNLHSKRKHHQFTNLSDNIIFEKVIDWESSSMTKEDKPETAKEFFSRPEIRNRYSQEDIKRFDEMIYRLQL